MVDPTRGPATAGMIRAMVDSRADRREAREPAARAAFGDRAGAFLDLMELVEYAWHDCFGASTPPDQVVDDIVTVARGDLERAVRAAHLAVLDFRDLRMSADAVRASRPDRG